MKCFFRLTVRFFDFYQPNADFGSRNQISQNDNKPTLWLHPSVICSSIYKYFLQINCLYLKERLWTCFELSAINLVRYNVVTLTCRTLHFNSYIFYKHYMEKHFGVVTFIIYFIGTLYIIVH